MAQAIIDDTYKFGFHKPEKYVFKSKRGLDRGVVENISFHKSEPEWMRQYRIKSLAIFERKPLPAWGGNVATIDFDNIYYYIKPTANKVGSWEELPPDIKDTYDRIGIPEAEKKFLAGVSAQYESEVVYKSIQSMLTKKGVVFLDMDSGLREYPELVKQYFGTVIPAADNKFSALNSSVWSGGSFVYVPKGVRVELPLQAYFRINAANMGQFERTLIIADEGSYVHYVEGCTAPIYTTDSLHSAVVEIIVKKGARVRYTTIQNWSKNVYNLVTKRARVEEEGIMEWVDGNLGCLAQGSTVTTPDGIKQIEQLKVGEKVLSYDESSGQLCFRRVRAKRFSGKQQVHIVSAGERKLRVTSNHPFYSYIYDSQVPKKLGRYQLTYVRADRLKEVIVPCDSIDYGHPYGLQKPSLMTTFRSRNQHSEELVMSRERKTRLHEIFYTTDDIAWLLGYWLGDGNIEIEKGKTKNVIRWAKIGFSTPITDRARGRLMQTMASLTDAPPVERADGVHVAWHSKELAELFLVNGFVGDARSKRVPEWVWSLPQSQRLAFIAGYLDADGYVKNPRSFGLKSVNRSLLEDVASLLVTLGITPHLYTEFTVPRNVSIMGINTVAHGSHQLVFPIDKRFFQYVSPSLCKRAERCRPSRLMCHRVIGRSNIRLPQSVEVMSIRVPEHSQEEASTWDIEVEGTGNFVSQGFIVHNSKLTMKYPSVYLVGRKARGEILSIAYAGSNQHQDAGGKAIHAASETTSQIISKSISRGGGRTSYRGLVQVYPGAKGAKSKVVCDALLLDEASRSDTYPTMKIDEQDVTMEHEATVSKIGDEQMFYLESRGIGKAQAQSMIVNGFIEPIVKELPLEYAVEMNRLIELQMQGSVG
ncbi:MAG: FeS assembly protein SufB [Candidatus Gottesmanbacteria bacterium GW2011_GWA2_47_9]|uniref:FeS assembly protein SufB n=2 Tax=Candidatus Gottesmaniibacteriota TaxID=1752720 RepID=A0A0G1UPL6_9BACT|nr:MAG: FeS assembly protein SufB [Candidatus Gottesmanbacteria bacterium GW2011_GWA2_47_9]KKU96157.1 MAG: FeS assembly protein SufB [Candidatus Gottesmanbacteria bacterium GW2011_GWA1_48_13]